MHGEDRIRRLRWLCRRGMKELDLLLEAFVRRERGALANGAMPELEDFLAQEDDLVWEWLLNGGTPPRPEFQALAERIRGGA